MKLAIFGATGSVGRILVMQALQAGHVVTVLSRGGDRTIWARDGQVDDRLTVVQGDALDADPVADVIRGQDAVLCVLGAGRKGGVRATGTVNIINGMKQHGVSRLVCQSTIGAGDSYGNLNFLWKYIMFGLLLRPAFLDHQDQEKAVKNSGLDWTIVRPAAFTDGPVTGRYKHGFPGNSPDGLTLKISRADVAGFLLRQLGDNTYLHRAPGLSY